MTKELEMLSDEDLTLVVKPQHWGTHVPPRRCVDERLGVVTHCLSLASLPQEVVQRVLTSLQIQEPAPRNTEFGHGGGVWHSTEGSIVEREICGVRRKYVIAATQSHSLALGPSTTFLVVGIA